MLKIMRAWDSGKNKVKFVYRDPETGRTKIGEEQFFWYFYVKNEDFEKHHSTFRLLKEQKKISNFEKEEYYTRIYVDREHNSDLIDKNCEFVWEYKDHDLFEIKKLLEERKIQTYEADLLVHKRWIIDRNIQFESEFKILMFDLETDDEKLTGQMNPAMCKVLSCAFKDYNTGKEAWICANSRSDESEKDLLMKIARIINPYDVLCAFNGDQFDFQVLKCRFAMYGIQIDWRKKFLQDHMVIYKKLGPQLPSYSLDYIAKSVVGRGKIEHEEKIFQMFLNNKYLLREYNLEDVRLMYDIEQKTKFLGVSREVNTIGSCPCDDFYISRKIDNLILRKAHELGHFHFKTKVKEEQSTSDNDDSFEGAFVFKPVHGLHKNVRICDFSALYPSVIRSFNLSNDTIIEDVKKEDPKNVITTPNGYHFRKDIVGIIPQIIMEISDKRNRYRKLMKECNDKNSIEYKTYERLAYVFKFFGLSFYGVMGLKTSRFYDVRIAESTTLGGQFFTKSVAEYLESKNKKILAGDSVTGDRNTIVVYDGCLRVMKFKDLFSLASKVESNDDKERAVFKFPLRVLSFNFNINKSEFNLVEQIIRHKTKKQIYRYRCEHGVTEVTEDHSLISNTGKCFKATEIEESAKKVIIPGYLKWQDSKIDLKKFINDYYFLTKKANRRKYLRLSENYFYIDENSGKFKRFLDLTNEEDIYSILRLCAHYICNGSSSTPETTSSRIGASIASEDEKIINQLKTDYERWFSGFDVGILKPNYQFREDLKEKFDYNVTNKIFKLQMMNSLSAIIFKQLCGQKANGKRIPDFIYMLPLKYQKFFFDHLIEGDGSVEERKYVKDCLSFETSSNDLISGISVLLNNLGYQITINYRENKKVYRIRTISETRRTTIKNECWKIENEDGYVYDLSVQNAHNFVDACGNILLHNTDSLFINCDEVSEMLEHLEKINELCQDKALNQFNCNESHLSMSYDKAFETLLILKAKKRYAGYLTYLDGKDIPKQLYVKGLEYARTDSCKLLKEKQKELIQLILDGKLDSRTARDYIYKLREFVLYQLNDIEQIKIAQKLTKEVDEYKSQTIHLKVVEQLRENGVQIYIGDKIDYYIESLDRMGKPIPKAARYFDGKFDRLYFWSNKLYPALERVLESVFEDVNWESLKDFGSAKKMANTKQGRMNLW